MVELIQFLFICMIGFVCFIGLALCIAAFLYHLMNYLHKCRKERETYEITKIYNAPAEYGWELVNDKKEK